VSTTRINASSSRSLHEGEHGGDCSYFEQAQGNASYYWERDDVLRKLESRMAAGFAAVREIAEREQVCLRDASYLIAIERVARACHERGWV
jgi:glutamate dehydrogenase